MTRMPSFGFGSAMPAMPDPWMQMQSQAQERQRKKKEKKQIEPISDEESNSLLSWAMGGLEAVGNVLDLPSSSIRDVVAGENPLDQWLHPLSSENRTTGRDLLRQWNMADKEDTWGNFLGGLGVEIASDLPLMMLTTPFSAVKAGAKGAQAGLKIAESLTDDVSKAAGKAVAGGTDDAAVAAFQQATKAGSRPIDFLPNNPAAMADQMRRGERGLIGLRNPLTNQPIATFTGESLGLNKGAASLLEQMFYGGNAFTDKTSAPIRAVRSLFSHSASGPGTWTMSGAAQRAMDLRSAEKESLLAALDNVMPVMAERRKGILDEFTKLAEHHGMEGDQLAFNDFMRAAVEAKNLPDPENISLRIREALEIGGDVPMEHADNLAQEASQYMNGLIQIKDTVRQRVAAMGGNTAELDDMFSRHFPRRGKHLDLMDTGKGRKDIFKDVPGGAVTINHLSRDPIVTSIFKPKNKELVGEAIKRSGLERAAAYKEKVSAARKWLEGQQLDLTGVNTDAEILDTYAYRRYIDPELRMATANGPIVVGEGKKAVTHTYESLRDSWIARGKDAQGNKLKPRISELRQYLGKQSDAVLPKGVFGHTEIEDWHDYVTSLLGQESTLRTARHMLTERGVIKEAIEGAEPGYTSLANAWEKAGFKPHGLTSLVQEAGMDVKSIDNLTIPQSMASSLKSYADALKPSTHKEIGKLVRQWDRTMALYRGMLTTPWPAFHARNLISGTFQAATHGKIPMRDVLAGEYKAIAYLHGNKDAMKFLHEVETSDILKGHGWLADTFGDVGAESASRMPTSWGDVFAPFKGAYSRNWNPLNMRGVRNHVDDVAEAAKKGKPIVEKQPWYAEAGENMYGAVEFVLRAGYYESLREKGFSAAAAKYYVKQAHFDYSKLSKFEKNVARRGSLFYTWRRKSVPHSLLVLAERPGGAKAQAIRAINRATQGDSYTPQYLKESVSIPVGKNEEGDTTYLRQGGLPLEDLNMLALRGSTLGTVKRTAEKLVSQSNPLLGGAIESLTGRQMYTGRQVKDLASRTEKVTGEPWPLIDRTLALSPVSRVIGEGEKAAGILGLRETGRSLPMNLANALSGLYFTTPDAEKWKLLDASNALRERLEEEPMTRESVRPYVPSKYKDMVSPEVEDMLKRLHELELLQRKQRDKKKTSS